MFDCCTGRREERGGEGVRTCSNEFNQLTFIGFSCFIIAGSSLLYAFLTRPFAGVLLVILYCSPVAIIFYVWWLQPSNKGSANLEMVTRFFVAGMISVLLAFVMEWLFTFCFASLLLPRNFDQREVLDSVAERPKEAGLDEFRHTVEFHIFVILLCYVAAGFVEECVKISCVFFRCGSISCCVLERPLQPRSALIYLIVSACGFSFAENVGYVFSSKTAPLQTAIFRGLISLPVHCISTGLNGVNLVDNMVSSNPSVVKWLLCFAPGIFLHGTFDLCAMLIPVELDGVIADYAIALLALGVSVCLLIAGYSYLMRKLRDFFTFYNTQEARLYLPASPSASRPPNSHREGEGDREGDEEEGLLSHEDKRSDAV